MLREAELIDEGKLTDAWDTPYRIVCRDTHTVVISSTARRIRYGPTQRAM
jgi:hypothetical protein